MSKTINSGSKKYLVDCRDGVYKIGNVTGSVPKGHDCILDGWHLKDGKVVEKGQVIFIPGKGEFRFRNSIIETRDICYMRFKKPTEIVGNHFNCPKGLQIIARIKI